MGMGAIFIFSFIPIIVMMNIRLPVHSSMLISGGRRERFAGTITAVAVAVVPISVVAIAMVALSMLFKAIVPEFTLREVTFIYRAVSARNLFIPLLIIPFAFVIRLIFYRKPVYTMLLLMLIIYLLIFTGIIWSKQLSAMINLISITALLVLGWGSFLLVLHYVCMKRSLAGNG